MVRVIVFGNTFYNTIGLVRSAGEAGYGVDLLVVGKCVENCSYRYSRYVTRFFTAETEEEGVELLEREYRNEKTSPIVLFAGDPPACAFDRHYDELSHRFRFFNCGQQGRLNFFMNKVNTFKVAEDCGIKTIKTFLVKGSSEIPPDLAFPCLVKGANSTTSNKGHLNVFYDLDSLKHAISPGIEYLFQEFLEKEYELNIVGLSVEHGNIVYAPAVIRKIRDDLHRQSVYIRLEDINNYPDVDMSAIRKFIKNLGYEGIFSVELLKSRGEYHFLEVNLRNDGCGYLYTTAGINYPALWIKYCSDRLSKEDTACSRAIKSRMLMHWDDFYNMIEGKVGFFTWLRQCLGADAHFVFNSKDMRPFCKELYPALKHTLKKSIKTIIGCKS